MGTLHAESAQRQEHDLLAGVATLLGGSGAQSSENGGYQAALPLALLRPGLRTWNLNCLRISKILMLSEPLE